MEANSREYAVWRQAAMHRKETDPVHKKPALIKIGVKSADYQLLLANKAKWTHKGVICRKTCFN